MVSKCLIESCSNSKEKLLFELLNENRCLFNKQLTCYSSFKSQFSIKAFYH